jgi:tetratricopeptide (TPR) repeat protein
MVRGAHAGILQSRGLEVESSSPQEERSMRDIRRFKAAVALFAFLFLQSATRLSGAPADQLGKVNSPTTCSGDVQPTLEKGLALLHSFQYKESEQTFTEAATHEPNCAMAHWGKALALYHQLWDFPQEDTLKEGRKDIEQAKKVRSGDPRDQGFIAAAAAFFQKSKMSHVDRIKAYSAAMGRFYMDNLGDSEIGSFYALSLIALAEEDVDSIGNRERAIAILNPLLEKYPDHPGVAHYLIHAADRPELASQGLGAARRYAAIAPDSSHALHMPSHIFVRLGLWQDSIQSNIAASASGAHAAEMHLAEAHYQTHAMDFLSYSYLQSGQEAKAREVIEHTSQIVGATDQGRARDRDYLSARTAMELHRWKEAAELPLPADRKNWDDTTIWARAIGAARSGDAEAAESAVKELTELVAGRAERSRKQGYKPSGEKPSDLAEAQAWLAFAQGKSDEALAELRAAADRQDKNGGESVGIPAREMLADMLLEAKRPADALAEYKASLKLSPNRFDSLYGAMRAAASIHTPEMHAAAESYLLQFMNCCGLGGDRPEIKDVGKFVLNPPQEVPVEALHD